MSDQKKDQEISGLKELSLSSKIFLEDGRSLLVLVCENGDDRGKAYPLYQEEMLVGRYDEDSGTDPAIDLAPQEVSLETKTVSRRHAIIRTDGETWTIEDLASTNGTYVNEDDLPPGKRWTFKAGDTIRIGGVHLSVERGPATSYLRFSAE